MVRLRGGPPKLAQRLVNLAEAPDAGRLPPGGKQAAVALLSEAGINQQNDALVCLGANHAANGLENAVHAGKRIGVVESGPRLFLEIVADQVALDAELRQSNAHNDRADQPVTDEIYTLAEHPAHHGKAHERLAMLGSEGEQESVTLGFAHAGTLYQNRNCRV